MARERDMKQTRKKHGAGLKQRWRWRRSRATGRLPKIAPNGFGIRGMSDKRKPRAGSGFRGRKSGKAGAAGVEQGRGEDGMDGHNGACRRLVASIAAAA